MQNFQFRLQPLLRLREHHRDQAQMALGKALAAWEQHRQEQRDAQEELAELVNDLRRRAEGGTVNIERLLEGNRYSMTLKTRLANIASAMRQAAEEVERCRLKLVEADKEVKVLEKLHQRQLDEHRRSAAQYENKQMDEAAMIQTARKSRTA